MAHESSLEYAKSLDRDEHSSSLRNEFVIPTRADLKRHTAQKVQGRDINDTRDEGDTTPSVYLCGNSLGLQPKRVSSYVQRYLSVWGTKGVFGHFKPLDDQLTSPWLDIGDDPKKPLAKIVGAHEGEVAVMASLTANLHFLMASFYRPTTERWKIIIERKAFPSDHYAVESQIHHHALSLPSTLIFLDPPAPSTHYLPTSTILSTIDAHASTTALLLLPGVQFYSGQTLDMPLITAYAHSKGITVGWDLAHAVGNVELQLHDWGVDFAAWCHYKYMNAGPGAIAGLFVHERHGKVTRKPAEGGAAGADAAPDYDYTPRLSGWWGGDRSSRFRMENRFVPIAGAAGWQVSNPSAIDTTALMASLAVFDMTSMAAVRRRSLKLTGYLEKLLDEIDVQTEAGAGGGAKAFEIITPRRVEERGAQLSVALADGLLEPVLEYLEEEGVVVDERRPSVIRVAPAPLYNSFEDCWRFVQVFKQALQHSIKGKETTGASKTLHDNDDT